MGDTRFLAAYEKLTSAPDRAGALARLSDEEVVEALAAASQANEPLLANILATEATNRMRRLRASLADLGEGVITLGQDGCVRWSNAAADWLLGLPREEIMGRTLEELLRADVGAIVEAMTARRRGSGELARLPRPDGTKIDLFYTVSPIHGPHGEDVGTVLSLADDTKRRRYERVLRESEQTFRSLFENFPDAVLRANVEGVILDVNGSTERLLGVPAAALRGRSFVEILAPEDVEPSLELFGHVARGEVARAAVRLVRHDGAFIEVDAIGIPIVVDGEVVGIHGLARERAPGGSGQTS